MNRTSISFFAALTVALVLTSCSDSNSEPTSNPADNSQKVEATPNQSAPAQQNEMTDAEREARTQRLAQIQQERKESLENNPVLKKEYNTTSTFKYITTAPEFSTFAKLVLGSDLAKQMHNSQITLFAPDDKAMKDIDQGIYHMLLKPEHKEALNTYVKGHMCTYVVDSKKILERDGLVDFNDRPIKVKGGNPISINGVKASGSDIETSAGMIIQVDGPIDFPISL